MLKPEDALRKDRTQPSGNAMEHRHFATIADIINRRFTQSIGGHEANFIANIFADELARTNPRFDRARFLRAYGV